MEESMVVNKKKSSEGLDLPPGFRFHPTDEEIISCYLTPKVLDSSFTATAIGEADFNKCEPWDLPTNQWNADKAKYFFCQRDRKYPTGMRTNRATDSGYWKATGKDKEIFKGKGNLVGMKKTLVFYTGRAPKGQKTNWVMHEFRLQPNFKAAKDEWVVSRVFHKSNEMKKNNTIPIQGVSRITNSFEDDFIDSSHSSLPPLMDPSYTNTPDDDFKANPPPPHPSSSIPLSDGYYLPNVINNHQQLMMMMKQPRHHQYYNNVPTINNNTQPNFSSFHHNDHNSMINNTTNTTYDDVVFGMLEKEKQYCKKEPLLFSCTTNTTTNQSSVDTGVTSAVNDRNADTCSVVSKLVVHNNNNNNNLYEDLHAPSSSVGIGPLSDFECLWSDY